MQPRIICAVIVLAVALNAPVLAQSTRVSGHVRDESGKPMAGVVVKLEAVDGSLALEESTKRKGQFFFAMVRRGVWRLATDAEGLRVSEVDAEGRDRDRRVTFEFAGSVAPGSPLPEFEVGDTDTVTYDLTLAPTSSGSGEFGTGVALLETGEIVDLIRDGKRAKAREEISRSMEAAPDDPKLHYLMAYVEMEDGDPNAALIAIDRALELDTSFPGAHLLKGILLEETGEEDGALAEFREEIQVSDELQVQRDAWVRIAVLSRKRGEDDVAADALRRLIEIDPTDSTAHAQLIDVYTRTGRQDELSSLLENAPADVRDDPAIHFNIGASLYNDGNASAAAAALERAIEIDPSMKEAHRLLGYCKVNLGDLGGAITEFRRYIELAPEAPDAAEVRDLISALAEQTGTR